MSKLNDRENEIISYESPEVIKENIDLVFGQYLISSMYLKRTDKERYEMVKSWFALQDYFLALMKETESKEGGE
ncbi:hypothetical protein [Draconibacterium mangrovi]|uniref:hypothetical protein n=1 Tax=Draconibacterium mangrovi TaxID=2697469 RepID=UPI0013D0EB1F|nr:hypothetical protein [Draconibacterium mangrovi]